MKSKNKLPKAIETELNKALNHLFALVDTSEKSTCAISKEHKDAVSVYVQTWIIPRIDNVLSWNDGELCLKDYMNRHIGRY